MGFEDNITHMDDINAFGYLSHGLCHEVTIAGMDAQVSSSPSVTGKMSTYT